MATRILVVLLLLTGAARAEEHERTRVVGYELFFGLLEQRGHGWQSQAGPAGEPGSQRATIWQPMARFFLADGEHVRHTVVIPVDVVTSASADALDAVSSASYQNEAGTIDVTSEMDRGDSTYSLSYGFHVEEQLRTVMWGVGWLRRLAQDNAALSLSLRSSYDYFDNIDAHGVTHEQRTRVAGNANLGFSQILSPTTLFDASYGWTYQTGVLEQTWNAVPRLPGQSVLSERFPTERQRHALGARLAQHVPWTRTTFKLAYRFYADDFGVDAHTVEGRVYQYVGRAVIARGLVRYHTQDGADFYMERFSPDMDMLAPRTADSDLAPLHSWHLGGQVKLLGEKTGWSRLAGQRLSLGVEWYQRSNDLDVWGLSLAWSRSL